MGHRQDCGAHFWRVVNKGVPPKIKKKTFGYRSQRVKLNDKAKQLLAASYTTVDPLVFLESFIRVFQKTPFCKRSPGPEQTVTIQAASYP